MINIVGSVGAFTVSWDPSYEPDILGYVICGVPGSADFAVSGSNILNVGPETSFTYYPTTSGPFSVKIAAYDSFSNPKALILSDLNFSSLQTVEVLGLASEVLSALNGELTEDHLYQALNDRLDLIDDPTTGLMTLYPRVSMTEGQYTVKLNSNGHTVGFGLANTAYNGTPLSEFMILADKFKVVHPTLPATQAQIFTVGTVNGSPVVGINGAAVVSGTLIVDQNVAVGGSVSIAGATLSFAAPTFSGLGDKPTTLGALDSTAGTKLNGIASGADVTSTVLGNNAGILSVDAALNVRNYIEVGQGTTGSVLAGLSAIGSASSSVRFWAGSTYAGKDTAPFRVQQDGKLICTGAEVTGAINATSGTFSGNITSSAEITGGTFTGSVFRTAATGARLLIDTTATSTYLKAFDGNNIEKVRVGTPNWGLNYAIEVNSVLGIKVTGNLLVEGGATLGSLSVFSSLDGANIRVTPVGEGVPSVTYPVNGMLRATNAGLYYYTGSSWVKIA